MQKNLPRIINAWCMYDWANSVHALVIVSSVFPVYFSATAVTESGSPYIDFLGFTIKNSVLFSYSVSVAFLIVAMLVPFCTAIADFLGKRKLFMKLFCYFGASSCGLLYFFTQDTIELSLVAFVMSLIGWSGSIVFYNSFLPLIATENNFDRYSARGFSLGYVGSVLLMVFNLTMIMFPAVYGITDPGLPARISFMTVGIWWVLFAQIPFHYLPDDAPVKKVDGHTSRWIFNGFLKLKKVFGELKGQKNLGRFLTAFFVCNMGVQTVMYVATIFGSNELKLPAQSLIITVILIQLVGIGGSYLFSYFSSLWGNIYALMTGIAIWVGICICAYFVTSQNQFYCLAAAVGMVMGGMQSLNRATYSKLIPDDTPDTASYFSYYDVTEKMSLVIGTFLFGFVEQMTGSMRNSVLVLTVIFFVGFLLLSRIPSQKTYSFSLLKGVN
jgi:UMF1 family MFS transporter